MESTLPPDPFIALGVSSNATSAEIKAAYRKLVLRCHPDKVADPALKKVKQEEFHKIQQAYELIGDDEKLLSYKAELALEAQRKARFAQAGSRTHADPRTARYDVRTAAPTGASTSYTSTGAPRYEERRPGASRSFEDDARYFESRSKKFDTYEAYPKQSSSTRTSRTEKEPARTSRVPADRTRSDRNKTRDKEERRSRSDKFVHVEDEPSSNDEKIRYETDYKRRDEDIRVKTAASEPRRKAESRRSYEDRETVKEKEPRRQRSDEREFDHHRKTYEVNDKVADARDYMSRVRGGGASDRPSPSRTTSSRDVRHETSYDGRSRREQRPDTVRRSSARPRERQDLSGRVMPEIVEWGAEERRVPPSFSKSSSSPAELHNMRATPHRSYTEAPRESRRVETSPTPPQFRRSETMPSSTTRRKEDFVSRPSTLRSSESVPHSPSQHDATAYPSVPHAQPPSTSRKFYYPTPNGGGVREHIDVANGHPTIIREPNRHRARSPSPISRPPIGANRPPTEAPPPPRATSFNTPPQLLRTQTLHEPERGRRLFGETTPDALRRGEHRRQTSFSPDKVSYSRRYAPEDVSFSRRSGHDEYHKPGLSRSATVNVF